MVSSTAMMPLLPPASMAMLQMVMRSSMPSASMVEPVNSIAWYSAPSTPIMPMMCRMMSLPHTHGPSSPLTTNLIDEGTLNHASPVAMPAAASVEPTPVANAPSAPYVQVWQSAPMITSPGPTTPCSGSSACSTPMQPIS